MLYLYHNKRRNLFLFFGCILWSYGLFISSHDKSYYNSWTSAVCLMLFFLFAVYSLVFLNNVLTDEPFCIFDLEGIKTRKYGSIKYDQVISVKIIPKEDNFDEHMLITFIPNEFNKVQDQYDFFTKYFSKMNKGHRTMMLHNLSLKKIPFDICEKIQNKII